MPPAESAPASPSLRQRRRDVAVSEIVTASEQHIAEHGPAGLSLRAVARSLGMTVQALYHYFPRRDDLITALVTKAHSDLADAVQAAVPDDPAMSHFIAAAEAYRRWAIAHPERFQLIYGTPLRHYEAPGDGTSTQAVRRMSAVFSRTLFDGYTPAQLAACDPPELSPALRTHLEHLSPDGLGALPPPAAALFLSAWGHLHGLVSLEAFGHTTFIGTHQAELFRVAMQTLMANIHHQLSTPHRAAPNRASS